MKNILLAITKDKFNDRRAEIRILEVTCRIQLEIRRLGKLENLQFIRQFIIAIY